MRNIWRQLKSINPDPPLLVGTVMTASADRATLEMFGGGVMQARTASAATVGGKVFVRDGVVEGTAPDLDYHEIEV